MRRRIFLHRLTGAALVAAAGPEWDDFVMDAVSRDGLSVQAVDDDVLWVNLSEGDGVTQDMIASIVKATGWPRERVIVTCGVASVSLGSSKRPGEHVEALRWAIEERDRLRDSGVSRPWHIEMPARYASMLEDDYKATSDRTLRERILLIDGVETVT